MNEKLLQSIEGKKKQQNTAVIRLNIFRFWQGQGNFLQ